MKTIKYLLIILFCSCATLLYRKLNLLIMMLVVFRLY